MLDAALELKSVPGIGPARLKALNKEGIYTVVQLLMHLPVDYRDLTSVRPLRSLYDGDTALVRVTVDSPVSEARVKKLLITKVRVRDDSDEIQAVWYNQPWLKKQLPVGRELLLFGKCEARYGRLQLTSPQLERESGALEPVYRPIGGIPSKALKDMMRLIIDSVFYLIPENLPEELRLRNGLAARNEALKAIHFPRNFDEAAAAQKRMAFEQLLLYQAGLWLMRGGLREGVRIECAPEDADIFWSALPFQPTCAQRKVLREIITDMNSPRAMSRLVQGDVGCGKTAVAFAAMHIAVRRGYMCAMMAPTEILAQQHYESAKALLGPMGVRVGLLTGSMTIKQKREAREALKTGAWDIAFGTHALISDGVEYKNLGLVVTDEQHRFGVRQRALLGEKGNSPNVLVMSATPIPRTLALILYGDLEVSVIDELPPGRKPIRTRIVPEKKRAGMYGFIKSEAKQGHQTYIVCPLVEMSEAIDAKPAEVLYNELREDELSLLNVALVHGRMKAQDKDDVLKQFRDGSIDVLVSTTVIEVGVNVPSATIMVVENAERFGLAQLHQLRGRVGRGADESWCFLMAEPNERLELLTKTNDGFIIAQKDMELRGPGEIMGHRQSGALIGGIGMSMGDTRLIAKTHDELMELIKTPELEDARLVLKAARELFDQKLRDIAMN